MSGHSKWSQIKRKKGKTDAQRGKLFTRLIREITIAARQGAGNIEGNARLKAAVQSARAQNMPQENIKKAIMRGTGELEGVTYEEICYEGYGPGGVAILIDAATDNKNRTTAELRHIFSRYNGNLGSSGCVAWMFQEKGIIYVDREKSDEDTLLNIVLESGGEDMETEDNSFKIITPFQNFERIKNSLEKEGIEYRDAELTKLAQSFVKVTGKDAIRVLKLIEAIEEQEDVQNVYANFDIPDEVMEEMAG